MIGRRSSCAFLALWLFCAGSFWCSFLRNWAAIREGMDVCFQHYITGKVSLVPALEEKPPERVLDLGCGVRGLGLAGSCGTLLTRI